MTWSYRFSRRVSIPALVIILLVLAVSGCSRDDDAAGSSDQSHNGEAKHGEPENRPAMKPAPVAVAEAVLGPIASYYGATASLEAQKTVDVMARVEGVVGVLQAEEGDAVAAGTLLMRIENPAIGYRVDQAVAKTAQVGAAFRRLEQMQSEQLASDEELESARADYADAQAAEGLARLDQTYTAVAAPFDGVVTARLVDLRQTVTAGMPLYSVADVAPLLARVHVPSREFRQLALDQDVELVLDSTRDRLTGRIQLISPVIDPTSGTIKVTVEVPEYPTGTRPGDFAEVRIVTERRPEAVLVPSIAVVTEKGESVAYVAEDTADGPVARRRSVEVGFTDDATVQIVSGVAAGERVVVKGQRSLKRGQPLQILEGPGATGGGVEPAKPDSAGARGQGGGRGRGRGRGA